MYFVYNVGLSLSPMIATIIGGMIVGGHPSYLGNGLRNHHEDASILS